MINPDNRPKFKDITVVYGARNPGMLLYMDELLEWEKRDDINVHITVDGTDDPEWKYNVGFVTTITEEKVASADNLFIHFKFQRIHRTDPPYDQPVKVTVY